MEKTGPLPPQIAPIIISHAATAGLALSRGGDLMERNWLPAHMKGGRERRLSIRAGCRPYSPSRSSRRWGRMMNVSDEGR